MLPFTTMLLRLSLAPLEIARAYSEAFSSAATTVAPRLPAARFISSGNRVHADQSINSAKAMSTQFYDNQVTTVDYQILFTKRDHEAILESETTTVAKAMTGNGFASWKIAEFIRNDQNLKRPAEWGQNDYNEFTEDYHGIKKLKKEYLEFLQVDYQIISAFDRKPSDPVAVLRDIVIALKNRP